MELGSLRFTVVGIGCLTLGVIVMLKSCIQYLNPRSFDYRKARLLVWAVASLYPIGLGLKVMVVGPAFVRWYVGDIGFPVALALMLNAAYDIRHGSHLRSLHVYEQWRYYYRTLQVLVVIGFMLSCAYEGTQVFLYDPAVLGSDRTFGAFDPIDVLMYAIGSVAAWLLLRKSREQLEIARQSELKLQRELKSHNRRHGKKTPKR